MKIRITKKKKVEEEYKGIDNVLKTKVSGDRTGLSLSDEIIGETLALPMTLLLNIVTKLRSFLDPRSLKEMQRNSLCKIFPNSNVYIILLLGTNTQLIKQLPQERRRVSR